MGDGYPGEAAGERWCATRHLECHFWVLRATNRRRGVPESMEIKYINAIVYMVSKRALLRGRPGIAGCLYVPSIPDQAISHPVPEKQ